MVNLKFTELTTKGSPILADEIVLIDSAAPGGTIDKVKKATLTSLPITSPWTRSDPNIFPATLTDNVGIGLNNPAFALEVLTTATSIAKFSSTGAFGRLIIDNTTGTPNTGISLSANGVTKWTPFAIVDSSGTLPNFDFLIFNDQTSLTSFFIDGNTDFVGIGDLLPVSPLSVKGPIFVRNASDFALTGTVDSTGTQVDGTGTRFQKELTVGDRVSSGGQFRVVVSITDDLTLITDSAFGPVLSGATLQREPASLVILPPTGETPQLLVSDTGTIGIGTPTPDQVLDVIGNIGGAQNTTATAAWDITPNTPSGCVTFGTKFPTNLCFKASGVESFRVEGSTRNIGIAITLPNSKLHLNGSFAVKRVATAVSVSTVDEVIIGVTDTTSTRTVTIQTADIVDGRLFIIKDESGAAGTNNITIATEGSETIDGAATVAITADFGVARLYSDGSNLFLW